ncbi:MAG: hypothetical protein ACRD96_23345 [Bryobacteraceae bacterium]
MTVLIHLPIFYNPDRPGRRRAIEDEKFCLTAEEVAAQFHGGFLHVFRGGEARGFWWNKGIVYHDVLALLEVDVPDTGESRRWLRRYAQDVLIKRFRQKAIYMKFVRPVEDLLVSEVTVSEKKSEKQ